MTKYIHSKEIHSLKDPLKIVPEIIRLYNPKSVVDIGCGLGTFLYVFKECGVKFVLGIDGSWVDKSLVSQYLEKTEFQEADLEKELKLDRKFDLVISLEVAEHLAQETAEVFVQNLVNAGHIILFSAAIPNQGGQNHINEQWLSYWETLFLKHDYVLSDILRPIFWNDPDVFWWYKQNMVIFVPRNFKGLENSEITSIKDIIHYELYTIRIKELHKVRSRLSEINNGEEGIFFYLKMLLKACLNKLRKK